MTKVGSDPEVTGYLENWVYDDLWNVVWGEIFQDSKGRFPDGTWIHTSNIPSGRHRDYKEGDHVRTLNSLYILGEQRKECNA